VVDREVNHPEKRHLVVLLATQLWRYFWLDGNTKKEYGVVDGDFNLPKKKEDVE